MKPSVTPSHQELTGIYKSCSKQVYSMVMKNSGSFDDARDIFQESMIAWFNNVNSGKYEPSANICTYLYRVAFNKWMKELKKRGKQATELVEKVENHPDELSIDELVISEKQMALLKCMEKMDEKSRTILQLHADGVKDKVAALQMGISSDGYYRIALMRAREKMIKCMKSNQRT